MSSIIDELKAKRQNLHDATDHVVKEREEQARFAKREEVRRQTFGMAVGSEDPEAEVAIAISELAELLTLKDGKDGRGGIVLDLRRAQGDDALVGKLQDELAEIEDEIAIRKSKGDGDFIVLLAELERAEPTTGALLYFGRKAVTLGLYEELEGEEAQDHIRRSVDARKNHKMVSPKEARVVYRAFDTQKKEMINFIAAWFPLTEQASIARTKIFDERFSTLYWKVKNASGSRRVEIGYLDGKCNLTVERLFDEDVRGFVKLDGLTLDNPWKFPRPGRPDGKVWGSVYLEVSDGGFVVVLPESSKLKRSCEIFGLVSENGTPKRIAFGENFAGLRVVSGSPLSQPGRAEEFLCQAAGLVSVEDEPESTRASETAVGHALNRAQAAQ